MSEGCLADGKPTLTLSRPEAIVFIDFLMRFRDKDRLAIDHPAESQLLYDLCSDVENLLPELFDPSWREIVSKARAAVLADPED